MPAAILVRAITEGLRLKGISSGIHEFPVTWGAKEGLPTWVHFNVSDASKAEMGFIQETWPTQFVFDLQSQNPQRFRYRLRVDPDWVSVSGVGEDQLQDDMERWVEDHYDGTIVNASTTNILVDIPKPAPPEQEITDEFNDAFHGTFNRRRWILPESEVDIIVVAGGDKTYTKAQSDGLWIDKLTL